MLHHHAIDTFRKKFHQHSYAVFRVFAGLLFMQHGLQKIFGLLGKSAADPFTLIWVAGVIELFGGLLVALGLFTTVAAALNALLMAVAYFMAHAFSAWSPIANRGELALVYFAMFLFIAVYGPGRFSLDATSCKRCREAYR